MAKSKITRDRTGFGRIARPLAWAAIVAVIVIGGLRVKFDVNPLRMLPQSLPEVQGLTAFIEHFSRPDELILAVDGPDPVAVEAATLSLVERLRQHPDLASEVIWAPPGEEDPEGMADLIAHLLIHQDPSRLAAFADGLAPDKSGDRIEATIEKMTYDPSPAAALLGGYDPLGLVDAAFGLSEPGSDGMTSGGVKFGSADGKLRLIYMWAAEPLARKDYLKLIAWTSEVRSIVQDWQNENPANSAIRVRLTGEPAIMAEISGGMQRDMMGSGCSTSILVGLIFLLIYRRIVPLLALLAMLTLTGLLTFGLSGLIVRDLNAMNVGFGAILIGLTVDYGILIYQQHLITPGDPKTTRRAVRAGIFGASTTTAASFLALHAGSQPGLAALGSIVAIGTLISAIAMLVLFVPWLSKIYLPPAGPVSPPRWLLLSPKSSGVVAILTGLTIPAAAIILLLKGCPEIDGSDRSTRPRASQAYEALDDLRRAVTGRESAACLVVRAETPTALREELERLHGPLTKAVDDGLLRSFLLPDAFVPVAAFRQGNAAGAIQRLIAQEDRLKSELSQAGFGTEAATLLETVFHKMEEAAANERALPTSGGARWLLQRLVSFASDQEVWASVALDPVAGADLSGLQSWQVLLADWEQTTRAIQTEVPREFGRIFLILGLLVIGLLIATFRRWQEIMWVALSLALSSLITLGAMRLFGWQWNFVNAAAVLICLGAGSDYSIHMLLALQRRRNSLAEALGDTGQAVLVCALTSVVGFGSLAWASNLGLASLGQVCALALGANCLVATFLLPHLWFRVHGPKTPRK